MSAGVGAAVVLATVAGFAPTFVVGDGRTGDDLVFSLAAFSSAVVYAGLGRS